MSEYERESIVRENLIDRMRRDGIGRSRAERMADDSLRRVSRDIEEREAGRGESHRRAEEKRG